MVLEDESLLRKNLDALKKKHPKVWQIVSEQSVTWQNSAQIVYCESGKPNLHVCNNNAPDGILLYDQKNPRAEADLFLTRIEQASHGVALILGMGLGYSLLSLVKHRPNLRYIVVFELDPDVFLAALRAVDLCDAFEDSRVIISLGEVWDIDSVLMPAKRALMLEDIYTNRLTPCFQLNKGYHDLDSRIFDIINACNIDGATKSHHGRTFIENRLRHLTSMHHNRKLEDLKDRYKGVPAIIVAAGPSLDKNIDEIHNAVGKSVIIAVDTALPVLLNKGIKPDFFSSIDYNEPTYEKMAGVASKDIVKDINLICASWVACTVTKIFPAGNIFWAFGVNAFEKWLCSLMSGDLGITGAGTVAHLNFIAAKVMGCNPIVFVGQDLAYSYEREHADNVVFTGSESLGKKIKDVIWVKGVEGGEVPTTRTLHGYRVLFEQWLKKEEDGTVINATEGGAWMEGAEHLPLADVIKKYCGQKVVPVADKGQGLARVKPGLTAVLQKIKRVEKTVHRAKRLAVTVKKEIGKLQASKRGVYTFEMLPNKIRNMLVELDKCHNKLDGDSIWELFDEMTMSGLKQDERARMAIERLENSPEHYLEWLVKSVERTDGVNEIRNDNVLFFKAQIASLLEYHEKEKGLLARIDSKKGREDAIFSLAELYYDSGDYVLLHELLQTHQKDLPTSPKIHFYLGIILFLRCDYQKAQEHFDAAVGLDPAIFDKIQLKKKEMADFYYKWSLTAPVNSLHQPEDQNGIYYRLKGFRIFPEHTALIHEFQKLSGQAFKSIMERIEQDGISALPEFRECLRAWVEFIQNEQNASSCVNEKTAKSFYRLYGKLLIDGNQSEACYRLYKDGLNRFPKDPEFFLAIADTCFAANNFDEGIIYLKEAVSLDKNYATYWNNMGDNLQVKKDFYGAILAYKECYDALPENSILLKKIADCYAKLGNQKAADEITQKYENLIR